MKSNFALCDERLLSPIQEDTSMPSLVVASALNPSGSHVELANERIVPLKQWLNGDWAIVLSEPQDFAPHPGTPNGFVNRLADGVLAGSVKLIGFRNSLEPAAPSWLDHAVNDDSLVILNSDHRIVDLAEHRLASRLERLKHPFVVILDDTAQCRTTLSYCRQNVGFSACRVDDLLEMVATLRGH